MIDQKLIDRINELAKLAKERELTVQEKEERERLRKEYLALFREGFKQRLESIEIVDKKN